MTISLNQTLLSRTFPDQRIAQRRVLDTRMVVDIDPTQEWLQAVDRRHEDRRKYAPRPDAPSAFTPMGVV